MLSTHRRVAPEGRAAHLCSPTEKRGIPKPGGHRAGNVETEPRPSQAGQAHGPRSLCSVLLGGHTSPCLGGAAAAQGLTCQQVLVLIDLQLQAAEALGRLRVDVLYVWHLGETSVHLRAEGGCREQAQA